MNRRLISWMVLFVVVVFFVVGMKYWSRYRVRVVEGEVFFRGGEKIGTVHSSGGEVFFVPRDVFYSVLPSFRLLLGKEEAKMRRDLGLTLGWIDSEIFELNEKIKLEEVEGDREERLILNRRLKDLRAMRVYLGKKLLLGSGYESARLCRDLIGARLGIEDGVVRGVIDGRGRFRVWIGYGDYVVYSSYLVKDGDEVVSYCFVREISGKEKRIILNNDAFFDLNLYDNLELIVRNWN